MSVHQLLSGLKGPDLLAAEMQINDYMYFKHRDGWEARVGEWKTDGETDM